MKREFMTEKEANEKGLVYTGICYCGDKNKKNKEKIINLAAKEEKESNIPHYPVMGEGNMTVYADPIYNKRREYYIHMGNIDCLNTELEYIENRYKELKDEYERNVLRIEELREELEENHINF